MREPAHVVAGALAGPDAHLQRVQREVGAHRPAEDDDAIHPPLGLRLPCQRRSATGHNLHRKVLVLARNRLGNRRIASLGHIVFGNVGRVFGVAQHADIHRQNLRALCPYPIAQIGQFIVLGVIGADD